MEQEKLINSCIEKEKQIPIKKKLLEKWSDKYLFSFQFWGDANNNVFINKDDVEIASFGGRDTIEEILTDTLEWVYRVNRVPTEKRIFNINPNF